MKLRRTHMCTFLSTCATLFSRASAAPPPVEPTITLPAKLPGQRRENIQTFAWTSNSTENGETFYPPWTYNTEVRTWATSGDYFRRCSVGSTCSMWTACSEGWMVGRGISNSCGAGGAVSSVFCSNNILLPSLDAKETYSWYWCDSAPVTGYILYEQEPPQPTRSSASTPASTDASTTTSIASSISTTDNITTPTPTSELKPSISIGNVACVVDGSSVVLAVIGLGVFFFMRRHKWKNIYLTPAAGYAPPTEHPNPFASPAPSYAIPHGGLETKPAGVADATYFPPAA